MKPDNDLRQIGRYELDMRTLKLYYCTADRRTEVRRLSFREASLLDMLIRADEQIVETEQLLNDLWGDDSFSNRNSLYVFIARLKHYLAQDQSIEIINARGIGYWLIRK